jgi:hypothetical protein
MIKDILILTMFYILPMCYIFKKAFNMHKKYSSDDPFYGSHSVAILIILAIVPVLNLFATILQGLMDILEKNNKIK